MQVLTTLPSISRCNRAPSGRRPRAPCPCSVGFRSVGKPGDGQQLHRRKGFPVVPGSGFAAVLDLTRFRGHLPARPVGSSERRPSATHPTPYPPEFRAEAVRLVKTSGEPISRIAKDLGVSDQTLRSWVNQDDVDAGRKSGLTSDQRARMRELEKENRELREEREILRKAAAFFATETGRR